MIAAIQMHGRLLHWHPHMHGLITCGAWTPAGEFLELPEFDMERLLVAWQNAVFALYLAKEKIEPAVVEYMRSCSRLTAWAVLLRWRRSCAVFGQATNVDLAPLVKVGGFHFGPRVGQHRAGRPDSGRSRATLDGRDCQIDVGAGSSRSVPGRLTFGAFAAP